MLRPGVDGEHDEEGVGRDGDAGPGASEGGRRRGGGRASTSTAERQRTPLRLGRGVGRFVEHYNHRRYQESLDNVTPADAYHGRRDVIVTRREQIKKKTMARRKRQNLRAAWAAKHAGSVSWKSGPMIQTSLTTYKW